MRSTANVERLARARLDDPDHGREIFDRLAVHRDHRVADLQPGPLRRAVRHDLADFGRHRWIPEVETQARQQRARLGQGAPFAAVDLQRHRPGTALPAVGLHFEFDRGAVHQALEDREHGAFTRGHRPSADACDRVTRQQAGAGGHGVGRHVTDDRLQGRRADDEQDPVGQRGKQEIGERPGQQHQDARPDRLAVVGLARHVGRDRSFTLVEEFDVTP